MKYVAIPSELQLTLRGENISANDSGFDVRERFLFLGTEQILDLAESTSQWHADRTIKCCPALIFHLYTVHVVLNGHTILLVYKRKTSELYLRAPNELEEINPCLPLCRKMIDFEIACLLVFEESFPNVSIKGKYFF